MIEYGEIEYGEIEYGDRRTSICVGELLEKLACHVGAAGSCLLPSVARDYPSNS